MKTRHAISHFPGREQQSILRLKNKLVELYRPLIVFYIGSTVRCQSNRSCFTIPEKTDNWSFSCDLVLVMPNGANFPENVGREMQSLSNEYDQIRLIAHPMDYVVRQLEEHSLFFCWVQRNAIVLYEWEKSYQKLPQPINRYKHYQHQAEQFYLDNPGFENYRSVILQPLPQKTGPVIYKHHVPVPLNLAFRDCNNCQVHLITEPK